MAVLSTLQGSGQWSGDNPYCEAFSDMAIIIFTFTAIGVVAIITICVACCCLNAMKLKVVLFMKLNLSFWQRLEPSDHQHDVFVLYDHDSDDETVVNHDVIPLLVKHRLHVVTEDCFQLGVDQFTCLEDVITKSRTALVILTPNLLRADMQLYQLNQAVYTQIVQHNFKVIFLLCEKLSSLGNLPQNLRLFLQLGTSVEKYKTNWEGRLIYELKHKTKRSFNKRLTFGNYNLPRNRVDPFTQRNSYHLDELG